MSCALLNLCCCVCGEEKKGKQLLYILGTGPEIPSFRATVVTNVTRMTTDRRRTRPCQKKAKSELFF